MLDTNRRCKGLAKAEIEKKLAESEVANKQLEKEMQEKSLRLKKVNVCCDDLCNLFLSRALFSSDCGCF